MHFVQCTHHVTTISYNLYCKYVHCTYAKTDDIETLCSVGRKYYFCEVANALNCYTSICGRFNAHKISGNQVRSRALHGQVKLRPKRDKPTSPPPGNISRYISFPIKPVWRIKTFGKDVPVQSSRKSLSYLREYRARCVNCLNIFHCRLRLKFEF